MTIQADKLEFTHSHIYTGIKKDLFVALMDSLYIIAWKKPHSRIRKSKMFFESMEKHKFKMAYSQHNKKYFNHDMKSSMIKKYNKDLLLLWWMFFRIKVMM